MSEASGALGARRLTAFAFLWSSAILVHQLFQGRLVAWDHTTPLTFIALWALLRPSAPGRLLAVAAAHLITVAVELPVVVNHWLLMGFTSLGLLLVLVPEALRARAAPRASEILSERLLGPVRVQIVAVYLLAALAKLNSGFFDLETSCAVDHYRRLAAALPFLPLETWALRASLVGTLAAEFALPLLLLAPATRSLGLVGAWIFHLALGWNGFWDFSAVASAYAAAFLPAGALGLPERLPALRRRLGSAAQRLRRPLAFPLAAALLAAPALAVRLGDAPRLVWTMRSPPAGRVLWLVLWLALGALLLAALRGGARTALRSATPAWWRHPAAWIAPLLVIANGLCPYLGLKTEHSYAMFSNLRTEGQEWNHLILPRGMRIFRFQDELLPVLGSSDPALARLARQHFRLVPFALRRHANQSPEATVAYGRAGLRVRAPRAADDTFLSEPIHPLLAKVLLFRPVPAPGRNLCMH